ncbi:substrate-binding domain-containing protein [Petroclostridium sp. X23]|uniref:substrate-binding domain-containing protein n=1 Tax=Petroclostridium sp. X23 TaxID=3045146 RepID=UPI0024AD0F5E|nr:substrate-binding domain-containing protein [Petroclostridium sp. X23]WHH58079.1 substrate-binding domain-containing protein [Petroclostridium sp. X23]
MKKIMKIALGVFGVIVIAGCSAYILNKAILAKEAGKKLDILVVVKAIDFRMEFWDSVYAGIDTAAKEFDVNVKITGSGTERDIHEQIGILENAIKNKPDAVVLAANDYYALVPVAEKVRKNNIKLVIIDSGLNSELPDSFIATDSFEAGKKAGKELLKLVGSNSKIAIISHVEGSSTAIEREKGVREGLSKEMEDNILGIFYSSAVQAKAYEIAKDLMMENPDLEGIVGLNESSTVGAAMAIDDLGLKGKVKLVGFDSSLSEVGFIEKGVIQATVVQKPFNMGYLSIKTAVQAVKGKKVNKKIDTGSEIITKENMYTEENQKLLFPFM